MIELNVKNTKVNHNGIVVNLFDNEENKYTLNLEVLTRSTNSDEADSFVKQLREAIYKSRSKMEKRNFKIK